VGQPHHEVARTKAGVRQVIRIYALGAVFGWIGLSLLFASIPGLQQPSLADRLRPYSPTDRRGRQRILAARSFREVIGPLASLLGGTLAKGFGVHEELRLRLERVHATEEPTSFRVRQAAYALAALFAAVMIWVSPLLGFLLVEQNLANRSQAWQRRLELELPVAAEQLAMLLSAGFSLGSAMNRVADRSDGAFGKDIRRILLRLRQGSSDRDALDEWAMIAKVASVDRLVSILKLHGEASDLGRLVSDEARASREEAHRQLLETMERKAQQVWIPVTIAALLPGCMFLAVPFISALTFFSS
jgi:tight adherence protein C